MASNPLESVTRLLALATGENTPVEEARTAAMAACRLILKHGLLNGAVGPVTPERKPRPRREGAPQPKAPPEDNWIRDLWERMQRESQRAAREANPFEYEWASVKFHSEPSPEPRWDVPPKPPKPPPVDYAAWEEKIRQRAQAEDQKRASARRYSANWDLVFGVCPMAAHGCTNKHNWVWGPTTARCAGCGLEVPVSAQYEEAPEK